MKHVKLFEGFLTTEGRNIDKIVNWLGYEDFEDFIGDNPGCYEIITEWISDNFSEKLSEINPDELEKVDIYLNDLNEKVKNPFKKKKISKISFPGYSFSKTDKREKFDIDDIKEDSVILKQGNEEIELSKTGKILNHTKNGQKMKMTWKVDDKTKEELDNLFDV